MPVLSSPTYRLIKILGQGGMSIVYEAFDERLKRHVALKLLHPFLAQSAEYKARFLREAEAAARLAHPNIVQIFDLCYDKELYIITELLTCTLKEQAERINFFELPELSAMIIYQLAQALHHAHSKGIIHRDIKPENIMLSHEGHLKVMDFGIAAMSGHENLTQSNTLLGSLAHLAPEVINNKPASIQSDIYSLTTVFYWLVTNNMPFCGDSPHALLKAIVDAKPKKVQQLSPYASDSLAHIIERGMHPDPAKRFKCANELALALKEALSEMGIAFDLAKLCSLLQKPEKEFENFKLYIFSSIKKQINLYQKNQKHTLALVLTCRIQDIPDNLFNKKKLFFRYFSIIISIFILIITAYIINTKNNNIPDQDLLSLEYKYSENNKESEVYESSLELAPITPFRGSDLPKSELSNTKSNPALTRQELIITIWPFANIIVDGELVASDVKRHVLNLEEGLHRLKFTHNYAATVEKIIDIKAHKKALKINISMHKSKPAFLIAKINPEADIAINGIFKGSSARSIIEPILVPLPDKSHALKAEVIIKREGFEPLIMPLIFVAGQTQKISFNLLPQKE